MSLSNGISNSFPIISNFVFTSDLANNNAPLRTIQREYPYEGKIGKQEKEKYLL